jgi:hypothetical protein
MAKKTYTINGFIFESITLSATKAKWFTAEYDQADTLEKKAVLASQCLVPTGEKPDFSWVDDVDVDEVVEVLDDFFYRSLGITNPQQKALLQSVLTDPTKYAGLTGLKTGSGN